MFEAGKGITLVDVIVIIKIYGEVVNSVVFVEILVIVIATAAFFSVSSCFDRGRKSVL